MGRMGPFKTLIVDGFDPEQIWEEIQLRNEPLGDYAEARIELMMENTDKVQDDLMNLAGKTKRQKVRQKTRFFHHWLQCFRDSPMLIFNFLLD